jgi:Phage related protein.
MDWNEFFERTRLAAGVESFSKLAPMLGITDGAIGHYRQGRRIPQVWVVADALRIQGHPAPEKAAIEIMKKAALTSPERTFWKRLAATATLLALGVLGAAQQPVQAATRAFEAAPTPYYAKSGLRYWTRLLRDWLAHKLHRPRPAPDCIEARAWI